MRHLDAGPVREAFRALHAAQARAHALLADPLSPRGGSGIGEGAGEGEGEGEGGETTGAAFASLPLAERNSLLLRDEAVLGAAQLTAAGAE